MKILLVSGGSGGHIVPLVAVARALQSMKPDATLKFICSDQKEDTAMLQKEGFSTETLPRPRRSILMPLRLLRGHHLARSILQTFQPDVVFTKGGAVSIPVCFAAHQMNIPIVLHESDAVMGKANRLIAKWADKICTGFDMQDDKFVTTGNPIRPEVTKGSREEGLRITGLSGTQPILLVMGGSQGAEALNAFVRGHLNQLLPMADVIHITGKGKKGAGTRAGYWSTEFAFEELPHLYACSTLAISRAGAGSINELAANTIPMILIPIEGLANDHQVKNAQIMKQNHHVIVIRQRNMNTSLLPSVRSLIADPGLYKTMQQSLVTFQSGEASRRIAEIILQCIDSVPKND